MVDKDRLIHLALKCIFIVGVFLALALFMLVNFTSSSVQAHPVLRAPDLSKQQCWSVLMHGSGIPTCLNPQGRQQACLLIAPGQFACGGIMVFVVQQDEYLMPTTIIGGWDGREPLDGL